MPKINLCFVITKLELGGAQKQLLSLINRLDKNKFNLFLFTAKEGLLLEDADNFNGLIIKKSGYLERPINPLKDILALWELHKFIKQNNIDIVHTHSSKAGILGRLAARWAKVKIILHTVHGWSFNDYQSAFSRNLYIWLEKITAKFTDKLIVVSNYDKQTGLNNRIGHEDKYILIRYGIDDNEFNVQDNTIRKELGFDEKDLLVGTVSCLKPQKSPQDFIKLCLLTNKTVPGIKFLLVGDGILRKKIEKLIQKLCLSRNLILAGWRKDIPRILASIDIFVLTSRWEGLPISAIEAISASKPVIVTNTGGIAEVIEDGKTGFLIEPGDVKSMAGTLSRLLNDQELRRRLSIDAKLSLGQNFSLEQMVKNTQAVYENLASLKLKAFCKKEEL